MATAAARLAFAAGFPALLAGEALAQRKPVELPSPAEVGVALAVANSCSDLDGLTLCDPSMQPVGATFRKILCVDYGADSEHRPIVRCVFKGARMKHRGMRQPTFRDYGDGALDLTLFGDHWSPNAN